MIFILKTLKDFFLAVPNIALALSVIINVVLALWIKRVYQDKQKLVNTLVETLRLTWMARGT